MELVRVIALSFADDGKRVKVYLALMAQQFEHCIFVNVVCLDLLSFICLSGLCSRVHGGRSTCWNATAASWYS